MVQITGKILNSARFPVNGELIVRLDSPLVNRSSSPDELLTLEPHTFEITNGALTGVDLVESQTQNSTYQFIVNSITTQYTYYLSDGTEYGGAMIQYTDGNWYTGTFYEAGQSQRLGRVPLEIRSPVMDFHAIVPNVASVEFADLLPTGIARDTLPTTVRQVAELIASDADYVEALRGGPRFKGAYLSTTYYQRDDAVMYAGSSWVYIHVDPKAGQTPSLTNTAHWQILASKGDAGGTGGNDIPYDATGWNGASWAPSANVVRDIIEQLVRTSQLANYLLKANAVLEGSPARTSSPLTGDRSTQIATTQWIGNEFATLDSPALINNPSAPTQSVNDKSNKIATTKFTDDYFTNKLKTISNTPAFCASKTNNQTLSNGTNIISFNVKEFDTQDAFTLASASFTTLNEGWFDFHAGVFLERAGGTSIDFAVLQILSGNTSWRIAQITSETSPGIFLTGTRTIYLAANTSASLQLILGISGGAIAECKNNYSNLKLTFFSGRRLII